MLLIDYIHEFIERRSYEWAASTKINYEVYGKLISSVLGDIQVSEIKPKHSDKLAAKLRLTRADHGVHHILIFFNQVMTDALNNGETSFAPIRRKAPRRDHAIKNHLDFKVIQKIIDRVDAYYAPLFQFLALTGSRPCEVLALRWDDIDVERNLIAINKGMCRGHLGKTKTGRPRNLIITPAVSRLLDSINKTNDHVFVTKRGEAFKSNNLDRIWRKAANEIGVDAVAYTLRHSFATRLMAEKVNIASISRLMGHSNVQTTLRYYAGTSNEIEDQTFAAMQKIYR